MERRAPQYIEDTLICYRTKYLLQDRVIINSSIDVNSPRQKDIPPRFSSPKICLYQHIEDVLIPHGIITKVE